MSDNETRRDRQTVVKKKPKTKKPRMWEVVFYNDDYTTMDFVVMMLMKHFQKSLAEATHVMLQVHHKGSGIAGVFTRDVAETKVSVVMEEAEQNGIEVVPATESAEAATDWAWGLLDDYDLTFDKPKPGVLCFTKEDDPEAAGYKEAKVIHLPLDIKGDTAKREALSLTIDYVAPGKRQDVLINLALAQA